MLWKELARAEVQEQLNAFLQLLQDCQWDQALSFRLRWEFGPSCLSWGEMNLWSLGVFGSGF